MIPNSILPFKYKYQIHANEIVLLAYYIAAINIEAVYHDTVKRASSSQIEGLDQDGQVTTDTVTRASSLQAKGVDQDGRVTTGAAKRYAITDDGLKHFQLAYPKEKITKEDIFYYTYGLLHSPEYREKYADNLSKELPRIPCVKSAEDFWKFTKAGRKLELCPLTVV